MFFFCVFPQPVIYHACETANAIPEGTQSPLVQRPKIFQLMDILCLFCSFMVNIRDTATWEEGTPEMTWGGCWAGPGSPEAPTTWPSYSMDPTVRPKENRGSTSQVCLGCFIPVPGEKGDWTPAGWMPREALGEDCYVECLQTATAVLAAGSQRTGSHPWQGREEKTWQARWNRTSGIVKSSPGAHLKDDLCLSDACYIRLLPNFSDMGRRPSPISLQTESA